jgi:predicted RNA binding protein YcfA (HicA-like mRNA interferase family)
MPRLAPCTRSEFIRKLKTFGYDGPFMGTRHQLMSADGKPNIIIPNPHRGEISVGLLSRILRDASIDRDEWIVA